MYAKYLYPMWQGTKSVSPNSNLGGSICWTGLDTLVIDSERGWDEMKRCCSGGGAWTCSAFDVLMRKLSKMSNKSGSDSVAAVVLVGIFPFSFLLLTLLLWQVLPSLQLLLLGKDAATSSSNAVSIVCLSTWIWLLWDPFVFILALQKPGVRRERKEH